ncbi:cell wall-associated NlpC family hydrolase [Alkalibacillus flavidus]|uniref:Cell wall-associated NlpC family hydrolase n=1 Tax=Alkalibacillus flavidus TaxID=546021 RepID=A0ABV2KT28_9BACI
MVQTTPTKKMLVSAIAGNLAISSPIAFYTPIDYEASAAVQSTPLVYGDHGESVLMLHRKLKRVQYYPKEPTPHYNALTEHAIKRFQQDYQLVENGELDQETAEMLEHIVYDHYITTINHIGEKIKYGEQSDNVGQVQASLKAIGLFDYEVDRIAGPKTKQALKRYQQLHKETLDLSALSPPERSTSPTQNVQLVSKQEVKSQSSSKASTSTQNGSVIGVARSLIGTPYRWGGTSRNGFDCSGFLQYVYQQNGQHLPRTVNDMWNVTSPVNNPSVGDLVFFETYQPGPSHAGVYIGNGQFIHAGTSTGVTISSLSDSYWQQRYLGARVVH